MSLTHGQDQINSIHKTQNGVANFCLVIAVAEQHQSAGDDVMGEHLPVVLSLLLNVDNHNLL